MIAPSEITLSMQIDAVKREIAMRRRVYPSRVERSVMTARDAELQIAAMCAVLQTLLDVQERRAHAATLARKQIA